jgi:hypothetical protein
MQLIHKAPRLPAGGRDESQELPCKLILLASRRLDVHVQDNWPHMFHLLYFTMARRARMPGSRDDFVQFRLPDRECCRILTQYGRGAAKSTS